MSKLTNWLWGERDSDLDGVPDSKDCYSFLWQRQDLSVRTKKKVARQTLRVLVKKYNVKKPDLVFKDLSDYKMDGRYEPHLKNIYIDISNINKKNKIQRTIRHEFKHYLDEVKKGKAWESSESRAEEFAVKRKFRVGDRVKFKYKGQIYKGTIKKKNDYTAVITTDRVPEGVETNRATLRYHEFEKM